MTPGGNCEGNPRCAGVTNDQGWLEKVVLGFRAFAAGHPTQEKLQRKLRHFPNRLPNRGYARIKDAGEREVINRDD